VQKRSRVGAAIGSRKLVVTRVEQAAFEECDDLNESSRGHGGFGSTGIVGSGS